MVLVVDGVELAVLDQVPDPRVLDGHEAVVGDADPQRLHEVVEVGDVRHHVVRHDGIGRAVLGDDGPGELRAEEVDDRRHARRDRRRGRAGRGVDAQHGDAALDEVLQEVAVVAGDLDHEAVGSQPELLDQAHGVEPGVLDEVGRERRVVRVALVEQHLARHGLGQLRQAAGLAQRHREREGRLRPVELVVPQQGVRDRRDPEVEHGHRLGGPARSARHRGVGTGARGVARTRGRAVVARPHRQVFQGARPQLHSASRYSRSRTVSMHCQKPPCW